MSKQDVPPEDVAKDAVKVAASAIAGTLLLGPVGGILASVARVLQKSAEYNTNPDYHKEEGEE